MTLPINRIADVTVSQTQSVASSLGFQQPLIVGTFTTYTGNRTRAVADIAGVVALGFATTSEVYKIASAMFAQSPSVSSILLGRINSGDASYEAGLDAIILEDANFYAIVSDSEVSANIVSVATFAEKHPVFYFAETAAAAAITSGDTTNPAYLLMAAGRSHSAVYYHSTSNEYLAAAVVGKLFAQLPGSENFAFQTLLGISPGDLSSSAANNLESYHANYFDTIGNINLTLGNGVVSNGDFIDIRLGIDWLESEMEAKVFELIANAAKIPYTDAGVGLVETTIRRVLGEAVDRAIITDDYTVTAPRVSSISTSDRGNRLLPSIPFTATLQGAINRVTITGVVSI